MKKLNAKDFAAINAAKNFVFDLNLDTDKLLTPDDGFATILYVAMRPMPARFKIALLAVLTTGTFTFDGFRMPATGAVAANFKLTKKAMKRHALTMFVDDPLDPRADADGFFTVFVG